MIWLVGMPLPPSVNEYLMPVMPRGGRKPRLVKTQIHRAYMDQCILYKRQHQTVIDRMTDKLNYMKSQADREKQPFALRVDAYFVFHVERIKANDANNRLKPALDGLVQVLSIDDRFYYAGNCEKVSTQSKDSECALIRISPMIPRTHQQLKDQIARETQVT